MIRSMTGFGKGEAMSGDKKITVEIRSLNSKQLDVSLKMPSIYRAMEHEVRNCVAKSLKRGKVDVYVSYESVSSSIGSSIDKDLFSAYFSQIKELSESNGVEWCVEAAAAAVPAILRMPDVIHSDTESVDDQELQAVLKATGLATRHLEDFRRQEGEVLMNDIMDRVAAIEKLQASIAPYESARITNVRRRIMENIESMSIPMDSNRFEQELIFYMEKLDINEEKVRLSNHCSYFREVAAEEQENGRKLGFIAQEMGREINTLGSKANDAEIQRIVVRMKDELEKIKEQSLNAL